MNTTSFLFMLNSANVNESLMTPIFDYIFFFEKSNLEISVQLYNQLYLN